MDFEGDWSLEAAKTIMLSASELAEIDEWQEVEVIEAIQEVTSKNRKYIKVTYRLVDTGHTLVMRYFTAKHISGLLVAFGLKALKNPRQVEGKRLFIQLGEDVKEDKTYVKIRQYNLKRPVRGSEVIGADLDEDDTPF